MRDLTRTSCPYLKQPKQSPASPVQITISDNKYKLEPPTEYKSQFLARLEDEEEKLLQEKLRRQEEEQQRLIKELEQPPLDKYWGHRVHAWVAILPELGGLRDQEISRPLFIEPSTGVSYKPTAGNADELYLGVESIWNDQNYWVNMQPFSKSCANIVWDLGKVELWEHVLPGEPWTMRGVGEAIDEDSAILQEKHLDMPFSYVDKININDQEYEKRYPNGRKTIFYKKSKVELYAPYIQTDGLVQRITLFDDYHYVSSVEIQETYANRSDNLVESKRNLIDESVVDCYERGRPDQCKEHQYLENGPNTVDAKRSLIFYHVARFDGLSLLEMDPTYFTQHFIDRDDLLYYRHVQFSREKSVPIPNDIHYRYIWKIIEEFDRNERIKASKDIAIREFAIGDNEIRLAYHYNTGQYSRATRMYVKPPLAERGDRLILNPAMTQGYNPSDEPDKALDLFYELETQLKEEDQSVTHVRSTEVEVFNFLKTRDDEYMKPKLLVSVFKKHRDEESTTDVLMSTWAHAQSERDITEDADYLKPYLARIGNPAEISKDQAQLIQHECLNDYKQLLVQRANKILRKFDAYSQELEKMQTLLTQSEDLTHEEEEKILEKMNEINFMLITLETRLNRHRDLVPKRYRQLVNHLQQSPYLASLQKTT
ncbi:dynein regulatory complex subunit 7-like [Hylaeus anthracinus]|uniref:dynein regulatory complex subunit 7-like n=1 Tax=Hylaeus anthracinus TaxID=313031 RepID=UPI0023BA1377|nr:dynein regulatory complex subunit 7-like [Hylaeus anthracinus]